MLPRELLQQVRRIEIFTNRVVNEVFAGRYKSVFKGQGIDFEEVRAYQPGDDIRSIDWNVTARVGNPYIKRFNEERELSVILAVDTSHSMAFGSEKFKHRLAAELCSVLAFSAIRNQDRVGLLLFSDAVEKYIPPKKGSRHVLRVIREVLSSEPAGRKTDIAAALEHLSRVLTRRSVVFLISDFYDSGFKSALTLAGKRHDVIAVHMIDPRQETMPRMGWLRMRDAETAEELLINTDSRAVREEYARLALSHCRELERMARSAGVDLIEVRSGESYVDPLIRFFRQRAKRQ